MQDPNGAVGFLHILIRPSLWQFFTTRIDQSPISRGTFIQGVARFQTVPRADGGSQPDMFVLSGIPEAGVIARALFSTRRRLLQSR